MSDDPISDTSLRASAYLDGDLSHDEMALAAADPALLAVVDQMASVQAALRSVEPPTAEARSTAIAAALAAFESMPRQAGAVSHTKRPSSTRWLAVAAAVVAVGALGMILVNIPRGGDDEAAGDAAQTQAFEESATAEAADDAARDAASTQLEAPEMAAVAEAESMSALDLQAAPAATEAPAEEALGATIPPSDTDAPAAGGTQPTLTVTSDTDLAELGLHLLELDAASTTPPRPAVECETIPAGALVVDAVYTESPSSPTFIVVVVVDRSSSQASVIDPYSCVVVRSPDAP